MKNFKKAIDENVENINALRCAEIDLNLVSESIIDGIIQLFVWQ